MPNENDKSFNSLMDSLKFSIAQKKGWDISAFKVNKGLEEYVENHGGKDTSADEPQNSDETTTENNPEEKASLAKSRNSTVAKNEKKNKEVSDTATRAGLTTKEWVKANPKPSGKEIIAYLDTVDDVEKAVSELKELSNSKALTINPNIRKLVDQYLRDYKKSNKNK